MLAWTIYISFLGVLVLMLLPRDDARAARKVALLTAIAGFVVALIGAMQQGNPGEIATITKCSWIPSLGANYHLAADGISLTLVVLTGLAAIAGILFSWNIEKRAKEFFAFYLALIGGVYGVFLSFDLFLLFVFYEIAIVPKYFIIAIWGSTRKEYGAMKLALYSFVGSAMVLVGLIAAYVVAGAHTFNVMELAKYPFPHDFQMWAFPLVFVGFAILAGMWPFHTWAPTGHVAAPTAASMLLAGVVMKLGAYGCLRVAMTLFPEGLVAWKYWIAVLAVIGIVYGALVALVQKDFKFVIGYSSVSHMGFVLLGLVTLNTIGLSGAVLQMFNHGTSTAMMFLLVGIIYERAHHRWIVKPDGTRGFGGIAAVVPVYTGVFAVALFASLGLPGLSGFISEAMVFMGAFSTPRLQTLTVCASLGIVLGAAYLLWMFMRVFLGPLNEEYKDLADMNFREKLTLAPLCVLVIVLGVFPMPVIDLMSATMAKLLTLFA